MVTDKIVVIVLLAIISTIAAQTQTACIGVPHNNFVNNPISCRSYYACVNQVAHAGDCPPEFLFNPLNQICDFPYLVDCTACSPFGIQAIPTNTSCSSFIRCTNGVSEIQECSPGLYFDPTIGDCNIANLVPCTIIPPTTIPPPTFPTVPPPIDQPTFPTIPPPTGIPTYPTPPPFPPVDTPTPWPPVDTPTPFPPPTGNLPDCSTGQVFIIHESDCNRYWMCINNNPIERSCAAGLHWNQFTNQCTFPAEAHCVHNMAVPSLEIVEVLHQMHMY